MSKKTEYKQKNGLYMLDLMNMEGIHKLPKGVLYEVLAAGSGSMWTGTIPAHRRYIKRSACMKATI